MHATPPRIVELTVGRLIPVACREHVLGDLCERYRSPLQYVTEAVRTIPWVVISRIRRTTSSELVAAQTGALFVAFLSAVDWDVTGTVFLYENKGIVRLALPALCGLVAVTVRDAYTHPDRRSPLQAALGATHAVGFIILCQWALAAVSPSFVLPLRILVPGAVLGLLILSAVRVSFWSGHRGPWARR